MLLFLRQDTDPQKKKAGQSPEAAVIYLLSVTLMISSPFHFSNIITRLQVVCMVISAYFDATSNKRYITDKLGPVHFSFSGLFRLVLTYFFSYGTIKSAEISRLLN